MTFQNYPRATASLNAEELKLADGDLTLDSGHYPYAESSVTVPMPDAAVLEDIEPGQRVTLNASAQGSWSKVYTPWTVEATNLIPSPSFETAGTTVAVRRNMIPVPKPTAAAVPTGWNVQNGTSDGTWIISTAPGGGTVPYIFTSRANEAIALSAVIYGQIQVQSDSANITYVRVNLHQRSNNGYFATGNAQKIIPVSVGVPVIVDLSWTSGAAIPIDDLDISIVPCTSAGTFVAPAAGSAFKVRNPILSRMPGAYFDGATQSVPDPDFTTRWVGTANASMSELMGVQPAGWVTANCVMVQSTRWTKNGTKSVRAIANHPTNRSYIEAVGGVVVPVGTSTGLVTVYTDGTIPAGGPRPLSLGMGYNTGNPNVITPPRTEPGEANLRVTGTMANPGRFILFSDTKMGDPDVWFDAAGLVVGTYADDQFDGNSTDTDLVKYDWTGTAGASTSTRSTRALDRMDWIPDAGITADLALVDREISHDGKTLKLSLASDESILDGWSPLTDDKTPRTHEANLRNLVGYVLNTAIPGASLQPGTANADLTARWPATNSILNPNAANLTGFLSAGNCNIAHDTQIGVDGTAGLIVMSSVAVGQAFMSVPQNVSTRKGQMWTFSAYGHRNNSQPALNGILRVYEMDSAGTIVRQIESTPKVLPPSGPAVPFNWERLSLTFVVENPATTKLAFYVSAMAGAAGRNVAWDGFQLTEGPLLLDLFSGSTVPAGYVTNWTGQNGPVANNSVSERKPADGITRMPELFTWTAGDSAWKFLEPLVSSAGYRLFCDEKRRWWLIDPVAYAVPGRFSARPDNTVEGTDTMDAKDENTGITGVVALFKWKTDDGDDRQQSESAGVPGKVKTLEFNRPFVSGVAAAHLSKVQGQNRTQAVTVGVDYTVRPGQEIQIDLPGTNAQLGSVTAAKFELTNGLMSVQSAGLRDTPPGSIDLLTGIIDALPGSIDSL